MKDKLLIVVCAASLLASAAALTATLSSRVRAADVDPESPTNMTLVAQNKDTEVFVVRYQGSTCFVASARGGSGISLQCDKPK